MPFLGVLPHAGEIRRERVTVGQFSDGSPVTVPVVAIRGRRDGPTGYLQAGVHGNEATGIEVCRRVLAAVDPDQVAGTIVAVPIANVPSFLSRSRYFAHEERAPVDMNRIFPGKADGLLTERIAAVLADEFMRHADYAIDLHSALVGCTIMPTAYVSAQSGEAVHDGQMRLAKSFGLRLVCEQGGNQQFGPSNLSQSFCANAAAAGVPAIIAELGESERVSWEFVDLGVQGGLRALAHMGSLLGQDTPTAPSPQHFRRIALVYSPAGGLVNPLSSLGQRVRTGDELMKVIDPVSGAETLVVSPVDGIVLRQLQWASCHTGAELVWVAHDLVE